MMLRARLARQAPAEAPLAHLPAPAAGANVTPLVFPFRLPGNSIDQPRRPVSLRTLSFLLVVLLPTASAAIYYGAVAADQYVAEFRMSLRTVDAPRVDPLLLLGSGESHDTAATESQIVAQYIASRAIVDELDPTLDLRRMFAAPQADWWARLRLPASAERLVAYWKGQVDPFYDNATGTIVVRARAFTPSEAQRLAQAIVAASEKLINDLSARARRDAVGRAEGEVASAEARLKTALAAIREFRDKAGIIDPGKAADATATLATKVHDDLLKANSELAMLKATLRDDAPQLRVLKARIRVLELQQHTLAREMTASPAPSASAPTAVPALSQALDAYEPLEVERRFAEASYEHALAGLDRARDSADRQHVYIESFVPPSLPETSLYPRRWRSLGVFALVAFAVWAIGSLCVQSIREHL